MNKKVAKEALKYTLMVLGTTVAVFIYASVIVLIHTHVSAELAVIFFILTAFIGTFLVFYTVFNPSK